MKGPFPINLISKQFKLNFFCHIRKSGRVQDIKRTIMRWFIILNSQSIWNGKCHADFWIKTFPCQMFAKFPKFTISENDQIIFCWFLQDNVSCGRGQNYQVYKHGFHEETSAHRQSSLLVAPAIQRTIFQVLKRKFDTNNKQRRSMTWWSPETSEEWKQKAQEARRERWRQIWKTLWQGLGRWRKERKGWL